MRWEYFIVIINYIYTMFRITLLLVVLLGCVYAYSDQEADRLINSMTQKNEKIRDLQQKLRAAEERAISWENKYIALSSRSQVGYNQDKATQERQASRIRQLENQVRRLQEQEKTNYDRQVKQIEYYKEELTKQRTAHSNEISKAKEQCQVQLKNQMKENNHVVTNELLQQNTECRREVGSFKNRIRELEESAVNKAKQLGEKFETARAELINRAKNFLTGKGPYTTQEEQAFAEFKARVTNLEEKIKQKLFEIDRIKQEKEDIEFQQKYCRAKLSNFDQQVKQLEKIANSKGKAYYVEELTRLHRQRTEGDSLAIKEDLDRAYRDKIVGLEEKLRQQLEENHSLYSEKQEIEQKLNKCKERQHELSDKNFSHDSELSKLKIQVLQLRKLIKSIWEVKSQ